MSDAEQDIDYQAVSYVTNSQYRVDAVLELSEGMSTPSRVAEARGYDEVAHISRALRELEERNLVELKVDPDTKRGRLYDLTEAGSAIVAPVREVADR